MKQLLFSPINVLVAWMLIRGILAMAGVLSFGESRFLHICIIMFVGIWTTWIGAANYKRGEAYRQLSMIYLTIGLLLIATYIPELLLYVRHIA